MKNFYAYGELGDKIRKMVEKLTDADIADIRERMVKMKVWRSGVRLTILKMTAYLVRVHPELYVELDTWSCMKDTKYSGSRLRIPGTREYTGYKLKVWRSKEDYKRTGRANRYPNLINHNTTETYRTNSEVARNILAYEEEKSPS